MKPKQFIVYVEQHRYGFLAYCPGLGCKARGQTEQEAIDNLQIEIAAFESPRDAKKPTKKNNSLPA
ncbi:MAG: hypothetical protein KGZ58_00525 [Ignavibacteriales bacterium]|nr:hypothetical protein [Ignavibacteriales bacterium]